MIIGVAIPLLVALVSRQKLNATVKALLLLLFSTIAGTVTSVLGTLPTTLSGWEHALLNILMTYIAAAGSYLATWKPAGTTAAISRATANFGIGPHQAAE